MMNARLNRKQRATIRIIKGGEKIEEDSRLLGRSGVTGRIESNQSGA